MCGVCDMPELWRGAAGLYARVCACAGAAKSLHAYMHTYIVCVCVVGGRPKGRRGGEESSKNFFRTRASRQVVCMYVCKDSAAPAHARTRAHRPAAPHQSSGVSQTPHPTACPQAKYVCVCKDSAAPAHACTRAHRPAAPHQSSGVSQTPHPAACRQAGIPHRPP